MLLSGGWALRWVCEFVRTIFFYLLNGGLFDAGDRAGELLFSGMILTAFKTALNALEQRCRDLNVL